MIKKTCNKCKESKSIICFSPSKNGCALGLRSECKSCTNDRTKNYFRTKKGLITRIYNGQKTNSRHRKHALPNYTKQEFSDWLNSKLIFHVLYDKWVESDYSSKSNE